MRLRRIIVPVHRDLGYFFAALTVVYAVSGVAVNHVEHFNPSYSVDTRLSPVGPVPAGAPADVAATVLQRMGIDAEPTAVVPTAPGTVKIFLEGRTLTVTPADGVVRDERIARRPVLFEANYLHLNRGKGVWTWFADVYAAGLAVLAVTGIFIVPGRKGLGGRGRWLLLAGAAVPVLFLLLRLL